MTHKHTTQKCTQNSQMHADIPHGFSVGCEGDLCMPECIEYLLLFDQWSISAHGQVLLVFMYVCFVHLGGVRQ